MRILALAIFLLAVSAGQSSFAQEIPSAHPPVDERPLTLAEAIERGLQNNLDVAITRYDPLVAGFDFTAAWGAHEPTFAADWTYGTSETASSSGFLTFGSGSNILFNRTKQGGAGVVGMLPRLGWRYDISYRGTSTESSAAFLNNLNPEYEAQFTANATVPLLKGFLWGPEWVNVRVSDLGRGIAHQAFRQQLMDTVQRIASGYWNLAARQQDLRVAQQSLKTASALLDQTKAQYEVGVVSRVEVVESQAGIADREFRLIQAENAFRSAQDRLADQVFGVELRPESRFGIVPTDSPSNYRSFEVDERVVAEKAFELRPELAQARHTVEQQEIQVKFARNQRLPQVDLVGSYGFQDLAGRDPNNAFNFGRRFTDADDSFFGGGNHPQWSGGVQISIPIGNTTARSNHDKSEALLRQTKARALRTEQAVVLEVRDSIRNLRSAIRGIDAAERRVEAASEQLRAEQIRLEHGESTPFAVLQREEDRSEAESQRTIALQTYHDSVAALERAQGTILRDRGIVVEDALTLR